MSNKGLVKAKRTVYSHCWLFQTSYYALDDARNSSDGRFFNCMTAMLFSAFCLEAYFNHLGKTKLKYWDTVERKLSPEDKLDILEHISGIKHDKGVRPFQTLSSIFEFRNRIVHAKTEYLKNESEQTIVAKEIPKLPHTKWEEKISLKNAEQFVEDTSSIIKILHKDAGNSDDPLLKVSFAEWEIKPPRSR